MSSIAIFPCTFTPAEHVVKDIAEALKLKVYDDTNLFTETSKRHGVSFERLQHAMFGRTSVFNQFTLEREKMLNLLRLVLAEKLAMQERFLFYGFLAALIPAKVSHVLRLLIVDTKQNRITVGTENGLTKKEARKAVHDEDMKAYHFTDYLFRKEPYDSSLFDMVVPVENKSHQELSDIVSEYFHKTSLLQTEQSHQAVLDMQLESEIEMVLLGNGHNIEIKAVSGEVTLKVKKSILSFKKLVVELTDIVKRVYDVNNVTVEESSDNDVSIYRRQKFNLPSKVLFVDDEKEFVQTVSERLISRDVGTYGVFNGEDALSVIEEDRPDVMVLDLKMPGLYGVEVLRQAKNIAPEVEVIILTGHGSDQDMHDCMGLGAFAYMNKPVDIEELSATIKAANDKAMLRIVEIK